MDISYAMVDEFEASATATYTVSGDSLMIKNDGSTSAITVTVGDITFSVLKGETLGPDDMNFKRFKSVTVTCTSIAYRLFVYNKLVKQ